MRWKIHRAFDRLGWSRLHEAYRSDLVSDSDEEKTSFGAIDGYLSDEFIEALTVELLSDGTYACLSGLALLESFIEFLLKVEDVLFGCRGGTD